MIIEPSILLIRQAIALIPSPFALAVLESQTTLNCYNIVFPASVDCFHKGSLGNDYNFNRWSYSTASGIGGDENLQYSGIYLNIFTEKSCYISSL